MVSLATAHVGDDPSPVYIPWMMLVGVAGTPLGGGSASYVAASYVATLRYCSRGLVPLLDSQSRLYQSFWLPQWA
jgi:hypothetical protein